jgi:hypothetical protein
MTARRQEKMWWPEDRGTGKTTRLIEEAIDISGDLPETSTVFVTGAHLRHLISLKRMFHQTGLVGVEFVTVHQILTGCLRGRRGVLLVDDFWDLTPSQRVHMTEESRILKRE